MMKKKGQDITPRSTKSSWISKPPDVDCMRCWPMPGYGHRADPRDIKKALEHSLPSSTVDIQGPCHACQGTGVAPVPFSELREGWDREEQEEWLNR